MWAPQSSHEKYLAKHHRATAVTLPSLSVSRKNSDIRFNRAGGSYGSGSETSRSNLIGRVAPANSSNGMDIPTIYANTVNDLQNLGNTFFSKAVMNKVPLKNRASYIPPTTTNKLLFSGDNPDNPAQSTILNSYVTDMTPYALPDFRAIASERPSINDAKSKNAFVRPFRSRTRAPPAPYIRPFRGNVRRSSLNNLVGSHHTYTFYPYPFPIFFYLKKKTFFVDGLKFKQKYRGRLPLLASTSSARKQYSTTRTQRTSILDRILGLFKN